MRKKNESIEKLVDEINKAVGDTGKSSEIFYLLKKQGDVSTRQRGEIIAIEKQILENERILKDHANKCKELFSSIKQQGEISQLQQGDFIELEKRVIENHKATKEILVKLFDLAKTLKVVLPKTFDVTVKNIHDFPVEFRISNLDEIPSLPDEVHIKQPLWLPEFFESTFKFITQPLIAVVKKQTQNITLVGPTDPEKAIAVRLSDGKRFYTAVLQAIAAGAESLDTVESLLAQILASLGAIPTLGNRYIITTNEINTSGTAEVDLCLVKNPFGSGKNVRIEQVLISSPDGPQKTFRIYRNPVILANGAGMTINSMKTSQVASIATAFKSPSITARGNLMFSNNFGTGSPPQTLSIPFVILPNENLLVTSQSTGDRIYLSLVWVEE